MGGSTAGLGNTSFSRLTLNGTAAATNSQTFNGTLIDIGPAVLTASGREHNFEFGRVDTQPWGRTGYRPGHDERDHHYDRHQHERNLGGVGDRRQYNAKQRDSRYRLGHGQCQWPDRPYTGYTAYTSGNLNGVVSASNNLQVTAGATAVVVPVDAAGANHVTDINTIAFKNTAALVGNNLFIGAGNTLRLGKFGGIMRQDVSTNGATIMIGGATPAIQAGNGTTGGANIGVLTAGGAPNTPGELVFDIGASSQTTGSVIVKAQVTDNGTAPVTFVKTGAGSMKLDGSNTYTGGSYILQGRVQLAGSEIGNANSGGFGTGPVFVFPGAYVFPSGASTTAPITNDFFLAGVGTNAEPIGAIRLGNGVTMSGTIHLIGDVRIGNGNATSFITGKITGGFNMDSAQPARWLPK